jgi:hypothetical protein
MMNLADSEFGKDANGREPDASAPAHLAVAQPRFAILHKL